MLPLLGSFFFQAEDGIRDLVRSRGLGDVYKRQTRRHARTPVVGAGQADDRPAGRRREGLTMATPRVVVVHRATEYEELLDLSLIHI